MRYCTLKLFTTTVFLMVNHGSKGYCWGFFAHKEINKLAIYTLPPELIVFYKLHSDYIISHAVSPDKRRYINPDEPCRHYIDLDAYHDSVRFKMPQHWHKAINMFSEDTLKKHGIVPWYVYFMKVRLTEAFRRKDIESILKLSADIGHYIGDAHVPLHTTHNYNGQYTNQYGIHGLWESRIPELLSKDFDVWVGKAKYIENVAKEAWNAVYSSHLCLPRVFEAEKETSRTINSDRKYSYEERNGLNTRVYSKEFTNLYYNKLEKQVESRFRASIIMLGSVWYTCWIDAGQPNLTTNKNTFINPVIEDSLSKKVENMNHQHTECDTHFH